MQRLCSKLRFLAPLAAPAFRPQHLPSTRRLFGSCSVPLAHQCFSMRGVCPYVSPTGSSPSRPGVSGYAHCYSPFAISLLQVRHVSSRERKKRRKPMTPVTSKIKKVKLKSYSSYKYRFRPMADGLIRRWKEGKRHNAHLKSKKSKRRLRKPAVVPLAYAKVMKKLNFCG